MIEALMVLSGWGATQGYMLSPKRTEVPLVGEGKQWWGYSDY